MTTTTQPRDLGRGAREEVAEHARHPWLVVTTREIVVRLTDRNFVLSTVFTLVVIAASFGIQAFLAGRTTEHEVAVVSAEGGAVVAVGAQALGESSDDTIVAVEVATEGDARAAVADGDVDAALLAGPDGWTLVGAEGVDDTLAAVLTQSVRDVVTEANAQAAGTSLAELTAGSTLTTELLEAEAGREGVIAVASFVFAFLFYMASFVFGLTIASSVLEEKQNRVVEILATSIPIRQLLYGKVIGNSLLAFGQMALFAIVALVAVNVTGAAADIGWLLGASGWFIVYFVAGFVALASVWAVLGSLASRSEDLQSNTTPISAVLVGVLFVGLFAEGTWLTVASYVPIAASVAMPIRLLDGGVAPWEPVASLLLTVVAAYALLRLGERVYQRAVMQGGTALTWRQAMRIEG